MATLPAIQPQTTAIDGRAAIIDIGSNSIRLVVYDGPARIPSILFNEKVMAGLGRGLVRDGALDPVSIERAMTALARFQRLANRMGVSNLRTVATAAVRDATNGPAFLERLRGHGLAVELLSGEQEAIMSGYGVLAGIPDARGIVGDLGGGSLELIEVGGGEVGKRASFPLGVLRISAIRQKGPRALDKAVGHALDQAGLTGGRGETFYLVGGSWRALARLDMHLSDYPLPMLHHYSMPAEAAQRLVRVLAQIDKKRLREVPGLSSSRASSLMDAAQLLSILTRRLSSSGLVVSAFGLREGLLHQSLPAQVRAQDPLICAAREEGIRQGRFPEHGDALQRWIAPLFAGESAEDARLRHATCLLADVGWRAHPDFRPDRGLETALHGNWVGIDARGRAMTAHALYVSFGGSGVVPVVAQLASAADLVTAQRWGLAIRLGQRLSGGVAQPLEDGGLSLDATTLTLRLGHEDAALYGEAIERRHKTLAVSFGLAPRVIA